MNEPAVESAVANVRAAHVFISISSIHADQGLCSDFGEFARVTGRPFSNVKSLIAQEERLATSPPLVTRLHLPHAIVVRLHECKINAVILPPETAGTVAV